MASKLLNVLKRIESGRQSCINSITGNGISINPNASLEEIAGAIDSNFESQSSYITNIRYYDNPFEDPDLPQIDPFVKDCENIFYNAELITQDGKTYYPVAMFLLDIDESMTETIIQNRKYIGSGTAGIALGYSGSWSVLTNDGSFYNIPNTDNYSVTHTWDNTKDLIDPTTNKHYKYVIGYVEGNYISNIINSAFDTNTHKIKVIAAYISMTRITYGNNASLISGASDMATQYIHFYEKTKNDPGRTNPSVIIPVSNAIQIVIDDTDAPRLSNESNVYTAFVFINNLHSLVAYTITKSAIYIKAPTFKLSQYSGSSSTVPALKYLDITDMAAQETIRETSSNQFPPFLKDPYPLLVTLNEIHSNTFNYGPVFKNIVLPNVTSVSSAGFQSYSCDTLDLPNYEEHTESNAFNSNVFCRVLKLNNLKSISATISNQNGGLGTVLQRLEMHSIENIPVDILGSKTNAVKILDLPNCISSSINFRNYSNLHTLILGVGYKGNLNLSSCTCLSRTSLLDLFNKVATLGEGESYTITLHSNYKHMFTDSEIKQVTDKGWTVAYYS